ncbi:MAG: hypothetical protein ACLFRZ_12720 [Rhodosalinus sp.]
MIEADSTIERAGAQSIAPVERGPGQSPDAAAQGPDMPNAIQRVLGDGLSYRAQASLPGTERLNGSERELVAAERDVDPRIADDPTLANELRDAYDLRLYREENGDYTLELHMDIEFAFTAESPAQALTEREKNEFIGDFIRSVESVWDGQKIANDAGEDVTLDLRLDGRTRAEPLSTDGEKLRALNPLRGPNFIVEVHADKDMSDHTADNSLNYVRMIAGTGSLTGDANDPVIRHQEFDDDEEFVATQSVAAHEFGHMIGLEDEYAGAMNSRFGDDHPHADDRHSIMNLGNNLEDRHLRILEDWVEDRLPDGADDDPPNPALQAL